MTVQERQKLKEKRNKKREKFEKSNCGGFELIYPVQDEQMMEKYNEYSEVATQLINEHNGTVVVRKHDSSKHMDSSTVSTQATISNRPLGHYGGTTRTLVNRGD